MTPGTGSGQSQMVWRGLIPLRVALSAVTLVLLIWASRGQALTLDVRLLLGLIAVLNVVISMPLRWVEGRVGDVSRIGLDSILSLAVVFLSTGATSSLVWVALFVPVIEAAAIAPIAAVAIWLAVSLLYTSLRVIVPGVTDTSFVTGIQQLVSVGIVGIPLAWWSHRTSRSLHQAILEKRSAGRYASSLREVGHIVSRLNQVRTVEEVDAIVLGAADALRADRSELMARDDSGRWRLIEAVGAPLASATAVLLDEAHGSLEPVSPYRLEDVNIVQLAGFNSAIAIDLGAQRSATWRVWLRARDLNRNDLEAVVLLGSAVRQAYRTVAEIDRLKLWSEELERRANVDQLTGVLNRRGLKRVVADRPDPTTPIAALYLDLNSFKPINDEFGHESGDYVLRIVANRFGGSLPPGAWLARIGGDEFAVVVETDGAGTIVGSDLTVEGLRGRLEGSLADPIAHVGNQFVVSVSVGIGQGELEATLDDLLRRADVEMYERKRALNQSDKLSDAPDRLAQTVNLDP